MQGVLQVHGAETSGPNTPVRWKCTDLALNWTLIARNLSELVECRMLWLLIPRDQLAFCCRAGLSIDCDVSRASFDSQSTGRNQRLLSEGAPLPTFLLRESPKSK